MKRMSRILAMLLALALMMGLLAACGDSTDAGSKNTNSGNNTSQSGTESSGGDGVEYPKMKLILTAPAAEDTENAIADKWFAELITEYSNGAITFDEYYNGTLCAPANHLDTIGSGVAQFGEIVTMYTTSDLPLSQIGFTIPFSSTDPAFKSEQFTRWAELHPEVEEEYAKMGVYPLLFKSTQSYSLLSKDVVESVDDLNGMKVFGGGIYFTRWFESVGAAFVSGAISDVYQSLKTNVVQASWNFVSNWDQYKHYEVAKNLIQVDMGSCVCHCIGINLDTWNSFDDNTKALFKKVAAEVQEKYNQWLSDNGDAWTQNLLDHGVVIHEATDEFKTEWAEKIFDGYDTIQLWIDNVTDLGYDGRTLMSDYLKIAVDMGYEFPYDISGYLVD